MSKYKVVQRPPLWMSAHRENIFRVRPPQTLINSIVDNADGTFTVNLQSSFGISLEVGERVFIPLINYKYGKFYIIKEVATSTKITVYGDYEGNTFGSVIWYILKPLVQIYGGWELGELIIEGVDMFTVQPVKLLGEFYPETAFDGYFEFDICGYLKASLPTPYKYAYNDTETNYNIPTTDYEVIAKGYNIIRVVMNGHTLIGTHYVANSSITTAELNRNFVDTDLALQPLAQPLLFDGATQDKIQIYSINRYD